MYRTAADAALTVMQGGYDLKIGTSERGSEAVSKRSLSCQSMSMLS